MRRKESHLNGERYCADLKSMQVHDLDFETPQCSINTILEDGLDKPFHFLLEAVIRQFAPCPYCTAVPVSKLASEDGRAKAF